MGWLVLGVRLFLVEAANARRDKLVCPTKPSFLRGNGQPIRKFQRQESVPFALSMLMAYGCQGCSYSLINREQSLKKQDIKAIEFGILQYESEYDMNTIYLRPAHEGT